MIAAPEIRKAAILLMSLPEAQAAQLLAQLEPKQVEAVSIEIAKMGSVSGEEQQAVMEEFANANPTALTGRAGGLAATRPQATSTWRCGSPRIRSIGCAGATYTSTCR
jgi:flagellar motor switch protein FliG